MNRSLLRSAGVQFSNVSIEAAPDGRSAWLRADVRYDYTWKRPGPREADTERVNWPMRKTGRAWVVY
jgi:hypothetical protein